MKKMSIQQEKQNLVSNLKNKSTYYDTVKMKNFKVEFAS